MLSQSDTTTGVVREAARLWPDAEAVVDGDTRVTFAELGVAVERSTRAAMAAGLEKGDRVAIWAPNSLDWIVAALGLHGAGGVIVPLNTRYKGDESAYVLRRSGSRLLFTVQGFLGVDYPALVRGQRTALERTIVFDQPSWKEYLAGTRTPTRRP